MIHLLLLSTLAFAAPGAVETKEELSLRLLGKLPSAAVATSERPTGEAIEAKPAVKALPTMVLPTVMEAQAKEEGLSTSTPVKLKPAAMGEVEAKLDDEKSTANSRANELLREQSLTWGRESQEVDGAPAAQKQSEASEVGFSDILPWWLPAVFFGGLGMFALSRRPGGLGQLTGGNGLAPMRVLSRTALGQNSGLALLELDTGDGDTRRILVGFGGGAPNLVTDLSGVQKPKRAAPPKLHVVPSPPAPVFEETDDFDFSDVQPRRPSVAPPSSPLTNSQEVSEPVIRVAPQPVESTNTRRSVLGSRSAAVRPPTFSNDESNGFAAAFGKEMGKPVKRRSADEARALVDEVLAEREPAPKRDQRRSRPWTGTHFEGTA